MYCQKFEDNQIESKEAEEIDRSRNLGIYRMVSDIRDEEY